MGAIACLFSHGQPHDQPRVRQEERIAFKHSHTYTKGEDCFQTHTHTLLAHTTGLLLPSSDVYALGVLMWEIFTGEKVFKQLSDAAGQFASKCCLLFAQCVCVSLAHQHSCLAWVVHLIKRNVCSSC